jgi:hypothetical protein
MKEWFLQSIGVEPDILKHWGAAALSVQHPLAFWLGLAALIPAGLLIYRRQRRNLGSVPPWVIGALSATRIVILLLLVLALSSPYLKLDYQRERRPQVALLFDTSESMQLPAGPFADGAEARAIARAAGYAKPDGTVDAEARQALNRISRIKLAETSVRIATNTLCAPLARRFDVRYYAFAEAVAPMGVKPDRVVFPEPPSPGGPATRLGDALCKVLDESGGNPVAGVLVFSDGQNTGGPSLSESARRAARQGVPVFTVAGGTTSAFHDVSVVDVFTSGQVALGDTARASVTIESHGLDGKTVTVRLRDSDALLDSKELVLRSSEPQQLDLAFETKRDGPYYLTVDVLPLPEEPESLRANNTDSAYLRVTREKIRVLYVEGLPRWDFRFLKNAMRRDHGLGGRAAGEPDILLESELRRRAPVSASSLLPSDVDELAAYHTVVLGDVSPRLITPAWLAALGRAVREKGVGLLVEAGPLFMPHLYGDALRDLLPVRLHSHAAGVLAPVYRPFHVQLTPHGSIHEAMRLYEEADRNLRVWAQFPPAYWTAAALSPAPGATVLAWVPEVGARQGSLPLVAFHRAGQGKVLFVGTDSTWLWRQSVGDRFFYKFWGQALRFVARPEAGGKPVNTIDVSPVRVHPGQTARIDVTAFDEHGAPRHARSIKVGVVCGNTARAMALDADASAKGRYSGGFTPDAAGDWRVTFDPEDGSESVSARIRVLPATEELRHPDINRAALSLLAQSTGGQAVDLSELASIPEQLKGEPTLIPVHRESTLWDNWLTLVTLVFLYSVDVGLRRLRGLS